MSTLTRFDQDGLELVIDTTTGESFATISGYARMAGVTKQAVSKRYQGVNESDRKIAEINTAGGIQGVNLINESLFRKWIIKDNPELAEKIMVAGVRVYLHSVAGYKVTSTAVEQQPKSTADMLIMFAQAFKEHEERLKNIEEENRLVKEKLSEQSHLIEAVAMESEANTAELERFRNGHGFYYSIAGYCHNLNIKKSLPWMNAQGRKASALCKQRGIVPQKVTDPRWGSVNTYPDTVLEELIWQED